MTDDPKLRLTEKRLTVLRGALEVAREEYLKHAGTAKESERVADQFRRQASDCSDMLELLETLEDLAARQVTT